MKHAKAFLLPTLLVFVLTIGAVRATKVECKTFGLYKSLPLVTEEWYYKIFVHVMSMSWDRAFNPSTRQHVRQTCAEWQNIFNNPSHRFNLFCETYAMVANI